MIQITNTGTTVVGLTGGIFTQTGTPSTLSFRMDGISASGQTTVSGLTSITHTNLAAGLSLPAGQTFVLVADTAPPSTSPVNGVINWMKISPTGGSIAVSAFFELRDNLVNNTIYSRVGVAASLADMTKFVIQRLRNAPNTDVGFALVNTSTTASATVTATLKDYSGGTIAVKAEAFAPGKQIAVFPKDFFALTTESVGINYHYIVFESTSPTMAATALAIEGGLLASFPVEKLQ